MGIGRKLDLFVFLTNFARAFVELSTPIFLYQAGFSVQQILLYHVFSGVVGAFSAVVLYATASGTAISGILRFNDGRGGY